MEKPVKRTNESRRIDMIDSAGTKLAQEVSAGIKDLLGGLHCYKAALLLVFFNLLVFHLGRVLYYMFLLVCFGSSFCVYFARSKENLSSFDRYLHTRRKKCPNANGFVKVRLFGRCLIFGVFTEARKNGNLFPREGIY
jgi:hypothetical protein